MIGHRVALRPRTTLETGDLAFALLQRHPKPFLQLLPWVVIPAVVCWAIHALTEANPYQLLAVELVITGVTAGPYTILCGDLMLTEEISVASVQKRFLKTVARYVFLSCATVLVPLLGFLPYGYIAFFPECILLERGTLGAALNRSATLLRAAPGRGFAMLFVVLGLSVLGAGGAELARYAFRALFGLSLAPLQDLEKHLSWAPFLGVALIRPYVSAMRFLLYIDCRTRREGWDLQVQFSALASQAASRTSLSREAA